MFEAMLANATRICAANFGTMYLREGDAFRAVATHNAPAPYLEARTGDPHLRPPSDSPLGRMAMTKEAVQVADIRTSQSYLERDPFVVAAAEGGGYRTILAVPMLKDDELIGAFTIIRQEVRLFTDKQIALVKSFANQAVIAIENTRLLNELRESLQQQTATADVLKVISRSAFDLQAVLDTLTTSATQLCESNQAIIRRRVGDDYPVAATYGLSPQQREHLERYSTKPSRGSTYGRAIIEGRTVHIPDVVADPEFQRPDQPRATGIRAAVAVPLLREGVIVGVLTVIRTEPRAFSPKQIELLETFADQAVIAIENTRLFEEVQARTRELTESLEYQTATGEILRVISSSPTDIKPVFDTISTNALRLCGASFSAVLLFDGEFIRLESPHNLSDPVALEALRRAFPRRPHPGGATDRAILTGSVVHIPDVGEDPAYQHRELALATNYRSILSVPMLRERQTVGAITVAATVPGAFSQRQVELLQTFADQAVIAIENTRLFEEVTALGEVGRAVSSTLDLNVVLKTIVERAVELSHTDAGSIYYYRRDVGKFELGETTGLDDAAIGRFRTLDIAVGQTGLGEAIAKGQPLQVADISNRASNALRDAALEAGFRAALIVPLLGSEDPLGALVLQRRRPGEFPEAVVSLMQAFADQSAIALENARLFEEIAQKSQELEIASQHKSQFVANMSHELRTPLAAILGYAELMQEGFYGTPSEKSMDALTRIRSNGKHLLGLINTVLDIAKIESGQFSLNLGEYALESMVETVRSATESLAETKKLSLKTDVAKKLPVGLGDEQRLTQVLLNLVGNAIKFTDTGEVRITATANDGHFTVAVTDTGPGIPLEELKRVFEQFHQVDSSNTKAKGGTGLGLAIAKQIVEMHGGRIWVESTLGQGATFQMQLPIRAQFRKGAA